MQKQNDWFATRMFQPEFTLVDFYANGITPDNSDLKPKEDYKDIPEVQEFFKDDSGKFNEKEFNKFYDTTLALYNQYDNEEVEKRLLESYVHDPYEWYTPGNLKFREIGSKIVLGTNPLYESQGIKGLLYKGDSQFSIREIAQNELVKDTNGNNLNWTPNEKGGLFKSLTRPVLVLAQYDEDTEEIINGKVVKHKKGDLKFNENGRPYYEELGDREVYGKDVLHYTDTITIDGQGLNAIDVFDNDGLDKSIGGTLMKTALTLGPLLIPGVGPIYGAIRASIAISQFLPVLGKTLNSVITGDNDNAFGNSLNKLEAWTSQFQSSVSDYSRQNQITLENFGSLLNQIGGQLFEQRAISYIPQIFNKYGNIVKNTKAGQQLALAYMSATSAQQTYQSFKEAGATDQMAGVAMLANIAALYKLMNIDYFRKTLFKDSFMDDDIVKKPAKNIAEKMKESLVGSAIKNESKEEVKKNFAVLTKNFTKSIWEGLHKNEFIASGISEGIEEMMEEGVSDLSKALTLGLNALGVTTSENGTLDFGFSVNDFISRYGMSFGGGLIGGALFKGFGKWESYINPKQVTFEDLDDLEKMLYFIADGRGNEIKDYYRRWYNKGRLGSKNLSINDIFESDLPGKEGKAIAPVDSNNNQNKAVYDALISYVDYLETLMSEENLLNFSKKFPDILQNVPSDLDNKYKKASILNLIGAQSGILRDFSRISAKIVKKRAEIDNLKNEILATKSNDSKEEKERIENKVQNNQTIQLLQRDLDNLRKERDEILSGNRNEYYVGRALFNLDTFVVSGILKFSKEDFSQNLYGVDYGSLTDDQKRIIDDKYEDFVAEEGKYKFDIAYDIYIKLQERNADLLNKINEQFKNSQRDTNYTNTLYLEKRNELIEEKEQLRLKINELINKQELTNEELEEKSKLETKLNDITKQIENIEKTPSLFLENIGENNTDILTLQNALLTQEIGQEEVANLIKKIYNNYKTNKIIIGNDAELLRFYDWIRSSFLKNSSIEDRFSQFIEDWYQNWLIQGYEETDEDLLEKYRKRLPDGSLEELGIFEHNLKADIQRRFLNEITSFIKNFGRNNTEAVNALERAKNILKTETSLDSETIDNLLQELVPSINGQSIEEFIKDIDLIRKDIQYSPFQELFKQFSIDLTGEVLPIINILHNEELRLAETPNVQEYTIDNPFVAKSLENALVLLDSLTSLVTGAYDGLNETINKYRNINGNPNLGILEESQARSLFEEIIKYKQKIQALLTISENNGRNKLDAQKKIAANMHPKFIKTLLNPVYADIIKDNTEQKIDLNFIWEQIAPNDLKLESITKDNYHEYEKYFIQFETAVYDQFKSIKLDELENLYKKLFSKDLSKMISGKLTDNPDEQISLYDFAIYFTTLISLNTNDYYYKLKEILSTPEFDKAPLFGQEFAVKTSYANALHPEKFNMVLKLMADYDNVPEIKEKSILYNSSYIFGGAGVGKTVVIAKLLSRLLDDASSQFVFLAPSKTQVDKIKNICFGDEDILTFTQNDIFKEITSNPNGIEKENIQKVNNRYVKPKNIFAKSTDSIFNVDKTRKYLIIDEVACFTSIELQLLSQWAQNNNVFIIGLGDQKQSSAKVTYEVNTTENKTITVCDYAGIEDCFHIKAPLLTASLRVDNIAKLDNYKILDDRLTYIVSSYQNNPKWTANDLSTQTGAALNNVITLKYYETNSRIIGEKAVKNSDELIDLINKAKNFGGSIAIYTDNPSKYTTFSNIENIAILPADNINGGEYDYAFVDIDWALRATLGKGEEPNKFTLLQDLYTVTQRSRVATVFVNNGLINYENTNGILNINNDSNVSSNAFPELTQDNIQAFKAWRLDAIKDIQPSTEYDQNLNPSISKTIITSNKKEVIEEPKEEVKEEILPKTEEHKEEDNKIDPEKELNQLEELIQRKWVDWLNSDPKYKDLKYIEENEDQILTQLINLTSLPEELNNIREKINSSTENKEDLSNKLTIVNSRLKYISDFAEEFLDEWIDGIPYQDIQNDTKALNPIDSDKNIPDASKNNKEESTDFETKTGYTNDTEYYNFLFSKDFINFEKKYINNPLLNLFNNKISEENYKKIIGIIESAVKSDINITDIYYKLIEIIKRDPQQKQLGFPAEQKLYNLLFSENSSIKNFIKFYTPNKGLFVLQLSNGIDLYEIPVTIINTTKYGEYTGKLVQVVPLRFTKSGKIIPLSELEQKYPNIKIGSKWGIVSIDPDTIEQDTKLDENTIKFLKINNGKTFAIVTCDQLQDNDSLETLWRRGYNEGVSHIDKESNIALDKDYSYSKHDKFPIIGINKRVKFSEAIAYATAMTYKITSLQSLFSNEYLKSLGLNYKNGILNDLSIFSLGGNVRQLASIVSPLDKRDKNAFKSFIKALNDRNIQILPLGRQGKLASIILNNEIINESMKKIINNNFLEFINEVRTPIYNSTNGIIYKQKGLRIYDGNSKKSYLLYLTSKANNEFVYTISEYNTDRNESLTQVKESIGEISAKGLDIIDKINNLLSNLNIDPKNAYIYFEEVFGKTDGTIFSSTINANETLARLFKNIPNISQIDDNLAKDSQFTYGVYTNDIAKDFYPGSDFYREYSGNKEGYVTDADVWYYPIYEIDSSQIVPYSDVDKKQSLEYDMEYEKRRNIINNIKQNYQKITGESSNVNIDNLLEQYLNNGDENIIDMVIETINGMMINYMQGDQIYVFDKSGDYRIIKRTDFAFWKELSKIDKSFKIENDSYRIIPLTNILKPVTNFAIFAYADSNSFKDYRLINDMIPKNSKFYVYIKNGDKINIIPTETYNTWKPLYDFILKLDSPLKVDLLQYISNLYTETESDIVLQDFKQQDENNYNTFEDLLIKHLQDKLDKHEC